MRTYTEQEYQALEQKLAKMELIYDKLANIHSKQEEKYRELEAEYGVYVKVSYEQEGELRTKYNKLKEAFEELLECYCHACDESHYLDYGDTQREKYLVKAGLKEQ